MQPLKLHLCGRFSDVFSSTNSIKTEIVMTTLMLSSSTWSLRYMHTLSFTLSTFLSLSLSLSFFRSIEKIVVVLDTFHYHSLSVCFPVYFLSSGCIQLGSLNLVNTHRTHLKMFIVMVFIIGSNFYNSLNSIDSHR